MRAAGGSFALPALALTLNAFTWGLSWWPLRELQSRGVHALWATALTFGCAVAIVLLVRPSALPDLARTPRLLWLALASGTTNAAFNWAVTIGDVVRVVLLFYLMPLWAVLLARVLLGEPITRGALLRVALALAGAVVVLWPTDSAATLPLPHTPAEWLGILGGFAFALNNVLLKREAGERPAATALAMFAGGAVIAALVAALFGAGGVVPGLPAPAAGWVVLVLALALAFLLGNLALQYGAARLPAHVTAVVMLTEVLFASGSAVLLGAGVLTPALAIGGSLIVGAALLAARD